MTKKLAAILQNEREYEKGTAAALRLQAKAWRLLAIIATHDQQYAISQSRLMLFNTLPFVNGRALERFIAEHQTMAQDYGMKSGVFNVNTAV